MHVALVASLVSPMVTAEANGPHAVIVDLARGLSERGHRVTVYAAAGSTIDGVAVRQIDVDRAVRLAAVRADGASGREGQRELRRGFAELFARLRADRPDVVSQHAFDAAAIELAAELPVLHTLHLPPIAPDVVEAARESRAELATVSRTAAQLWQAAGIRALRVLPNGVPPRSPRAGRIKSIGLIAGRVSPEKGTHVALRVARRAGLSPLIVGDVYDERYFTMEVEPLLGADEFAGPLPRAELFQLMACSAVLIMPVRWEEPFGLVAAEAQMAGCPVVAYRRGALAEVVLDGGGCLVEPDDEAALEAAVGRALQLDRRRIRARALAHLSVERMVDAYEVALTAIAARSGVAAM